MNRPVRPTHPTSPANRHTAAQQAAAQPHTKTPAAPPVYRPQPTPKVLQQKAATKTFGVKPPQASQPTRPHAAQPNQCAPVSPFRQTQTPSKVSQGKPAGAPRPGIASPFNASPTQAPHAHTRTQPRVLQPKTAGVNEAPRVAGASQARPSSTPPALQRPVNSPDAPGAGGVVQLVRKTKSKAKITRGSETTAIKLVKRIAARKDAEGRVSNVRSFVHSGKKVGRKSTTGHKTTDTSGPINAFLKKAKLISNIVRMEGGHCIADVFGGSLCKSNTVPLPHAFNTITYKKQESALKKSLPQHGTVMEVSVEYPNNPLDGFLTTAEQNQLQALVTPTQYAKLEALFSNVPDFMAWEVNNSSGGHDWIEFRDIRKDFWPTGHRPGNMLTPKFIKAVRKL